MNIRESDILNIWLRFFVLPSECNIFLIMQKILAFILCIWYKVNNENHLRKLFRIQNIQNEK